ncbi:MAG: GIY-YIG nuclease family protein [Acidobacteria bacterium]|nr:GIY-YIG nuclease family protein [Acidobacteriota bacterium]MBU4404766.1 GIY-YIG nuclease family protein [Acidobacteriota bacterium]MCG2812060.1 GIY-YIG nuclease family protein [Candidatus Aminicenantes bacterium]
MKKQRKRTPLVIEHLEKIPGIAITLCPEIFTEFARKKSGVYALYKGSSLYYVGLTKNLRSRLHRHLRDRHAQEWNRFSTLSVGAYNYTPYNDRMYRTKSWAKIFSPLRNNQIVFAKIGG